MKKITSKSKSVKADQSEELKALSFEVGVPHKLDKDYAYAVTYNYPGPLACISGIQSGCSKPVDAGNALGYGRFCDYCILCAGSTVTIMYNRFQPGT
jgi:hypothetical protein